MNKNVKNFMELDIRVGKIISAEEFPLWCNLCVTPEPQSTNILVFFEYRSSTQRFEFRFTYSYF